jgi:hypothetical protein
MSESELHQPVLLSAQRALLGEVPPALRGVALGWDDKRIYLRCYFDGPISEEDHESMERIATEMMADFFPERNVELQVVRQDAPARLDPLEAWAYRRRERQE